ncbi:hypothetical protein VI817_003483 [Penicillium citrinum]|nr:hypothetical protein VI817_003483 [Penicillium citrinum]
MEGFLLYAPPLSLSGGGTEGYGENDGNNHPLRKVQDQIHLPLFLPAPYSKVKVRREGRTGYVTIGPDSNQPKDQPPPGEGNVKSRPDVEVDLEEVGDDGNEAQNFWVDPPGYVDDIVWPRYVGDHSWLIIPDHPVQGDGEEDFIRAVGEGVNVRHDVGLKIAPGMGDVGMDVVLRWAVEEILKSLEL